MPDTPTGFLPEDAVATPSLPLLGEEMKGQLYPGLAGTAADRPAYGQLWPRGNVRGNG